MSLSTVVMAALVILLCEAGIVGIAIGAYAALLSLRKGDPANQVQDLQREFIELEAFVQRCMKRLSPGRPRQQVEATEPEPSPQTVDRGFDPTTKPKSESELAHRLAAIRSRMAR